MLISPSPAPIPAEARASVPTGAIYQDISADELLREAEGDWPADAQTPWQAYLQRTLRGAATGHAVGLGVALLAGGHRHAVHPYAAAPTLAAQMLRQAMARGDRAQVNYWRAVQDWQSDAAAPGFDRAAGKS